MTAQRRPASSRLVCSAPGSEEKKDAPAGEGARAGIGIALGGGGGRAFAHLGVLARLAEAGLAPGYISGSSMGAVLGAICADSSDPAAAAPEILARFRRSPLFGGKAKPDKRDGLENRRGFFPGLLRKSAALGVAAAAALRPGLRRANPVNRAIDEFFGAAERDFGQLALPFGANAFNLTSGEVEEFVSGPLAPALKAGVAVGLLFAPFSWRGCQYADAAPLCPVPVSLCRRLGAGKVLAVDLSAAPERPLSCRSGFDVVRRLMSVQSEKLNELEIAKADFVLRIDLSDIFWGDFSRVDEAAGRGRLAVEANLPAIRERLA